MNEHINYICERIAVLNPIHSKKLQKNMAIFDDRYDELADAFFKKYLPILQLENKTLDYAIDCYSQMLADVTNETVEFLRSGKYTSTTFAEVNSRVYASPGVMEYYMHGLLLSQFLFKHHYQTLSFFIDTLPQYVNTTKSYLEVGAGHGFYLSKALTILDKQTTFTVVDISETSLKFAKQFTEDNRVEFILGDIFEFDNGKKYDFITLGEVLEHVEAPMELLSKLNNLLSDDGVLFFTTPTNAPAIDHIYLFNNVEEIRDIVRSAGFQIVSERSFLSEDVSAEKAEKYKIAVLYNAFLNKSDR